MLSIQILFDKGQIQQPHLELPQVSDLPAIKRISFEVGHSLEES